MDFQISCEADNCTRATKSLEDTMHILDGLVNMNIDDPRYRENDQLKSLPSKNTATATATVVPSTIVDTLGSGDKQQLTVDVVEEITLPSDNIAAEVPLAKVDSLNSCEPLTSEEVMDMILPSRASSTTDGGLNYRLLKSRCKQTSQKNENLGSNGQSSKLPLKNISKIHKLKNPKKEKEKVESEIMCDMKTIELLLHCESCQEVPISSETFHTCDLGHQICGNCYSSGVSICVVCKGHMVGENIPLENVLRRLRQNYPHVLNEMKISSEEIGLDSISRFYSLKPLECPEDGCRCKCSARSLPEHFTREHKYIPSIEAQLFKPCTVSLPERSLRNVNGNVVAVVTLRVTDERIASRLFTDTMTCWVQCGAVSKDDNRAVAVWLSCVYEAAHMPPILYSVRLCNADGYSSFGGQMMPLLDYKDPKSVLVDGKCLLFFIEKTKSSMNNDESYIPVELKFYLG